MKNNNRKTFVNINILKSWAVLQVILIHVLARYKGLDYRIYLIWDLLHFSVGIFAFISGYLQGFSTERLQKKGIKHNSIKYLSKKFKRIVLPYYVFAILLSILKIFQSSFGEFTGLLSFKFVFETVFLLGGIGGTWIPRVFFSLSIIYSIGEEIKKKFKKIHFLIFIIFTVLTTYILFGELLSSSALKIVPGWVVIYYSGLFTYKYFSKNKFKIGIILGSFITTLAAYFYLYSNNLNTSIFGNKYPPNIFFVGFNILLPYLSFLISTWIGKKIEDKIFLNKIIAFLSKNSYEMFFYHLLVMKVYPKINILIDYIVIIAITVLMVFIKTWINNIVSKKKN